MTRRLPLRPEWVLGVFVVGCMATADVLRVRAPRTAAAWSMAGWSLFLVQTFVWLRGDRGWRATLRELCEWGLLSAVGLVVLAAYYTRSRLWEAGVHVDAVYTFSGLEWFFERRVPITFAAQTASYAQMPFMVLSHLPGVVIGFDRLGPPAIHAGILCSEAGLLALMVQWVGGGRLWQRVLGVALTAGVFSNRFLVQSSNIVGYAVPAVALAVMPLCASVVRTSRDAHKVLGGLATLALLHHYPGFAFVAPFLAAWLCIRRHPLREIGRFVVRNPLLVTVVCMAATTIALHPDLLFTRVRHVVTGQGAGALTVAERVRNNWPHLVTYFFPQRREIWFQQTRGTWLMLNIQPLTPWVVASVVSGWAATVMTCGAGWRYLVYLVTLVVGMALLTVANHLLTDWLDYRDFPFVFSTAVVSMGFASAAWRAVGWRRWAALTLGVAIAVHNWSDVAIARGRRFGGADYSPRAQEGLEWLRRSAATPAIRGLAATGAVVVGEQFVVLETPYKKALAAHGIAVRLVSLEAYCRDPLSALQTAAGSECQAFIATIPAAACEGARPVPWDRAERGTTVWHYPDSCRGAWAGERPRTVIATSP